jgi:hypothetical protein
MKINNSFVTNICGGGVSIEMGNFINFNNKNNLGGLSLSLGVGLTRHNNLT